MSNIFLELFKPFEGSEIGWRVGASNQAKTSSLALAYVDSRAVMRRLDIVLGPMNWTDSYLFGDKAVVCTLSLKIGNEWVSKEDGSDQTDVEAAKGGISTAFKRAAVKFGVGRYLYDLPPIWVASEQKGKTVIITDEGKKQAIKKLDDFVKNYYKLTPVLTVPQKAKLEENYKNAAIDFPTLDAIFGTKEVNVLAAQNVMLLMSGWTGMDELQKETETFKVAYATFSGLPYVYSRFV